MTDFNDFLDITCPSDALPLTDELFNKLVASDFPDMKKTDFDCLRNNGFFFHPRRRSFVQPPVIEYDYDKLNL